MKKVLATVVAAVAALTLSSCGGAADTGDANTLTVGASPTPHAKILKYISDNLAADAGITIKVVEYQDYIKPNADLASGSLDANYFQTVPYLDDQKASDDAYANFVAGEGVHLEPLGIYSNKVKDVKELKDGDTIGIIDDPANQGRGLQLLASEGLIKLPTDAADQIVAKIENSSEYNPRGFKFQVSDGTKLVRSLDDVQIGVINGNYAMEGGLTPADALVLESADNNPAVNVLVWPKDSQKLAAIKKLDELLHSPEVKTFIEETWADKSVIPAF